MLVVWNPNKLIRIPKQISNILYYCLPVLKRQKAKVKRQNFIKRTAFEAVF